MSADKANQPTRQKRGKYQTRKAPPTGVNEAVLFRMEKFEKALGVFLETGEEFAAALDQVSPTAFFKPSIFAAATRATLNKTSVPFLDLVRANVSSERVPKPRASQQSNKATQEQEGA